MGYINPFSAKINWFALNMSSENFKPNDIIWLEIIYKQPASVCIAVQTVEWDIIKDSDVVRFINFRIFYIPYHQPKLNNLF